jgi:hypothetical protein
MSKKNYTVEKYLLKGKEHKLGGLYKSTRPSNAVKKAYNQICRKNNLKNKCGEIKITLRETTRGSNKKIFNYKVKRVLLEKPKKIQRNGKEIVIKYAIKVEKSKNEKKLHKCCESKLTKTGKIECCNLPGIGVKKYYKCPPQSEKISCGGSSCNKKHKGGSCNKKH